VSTLNCGYAAHRVWNQETRYGVSRSQGKAAQRTGAPPYRQGARRVVLRGYREGSTLKEIFAVTSGCSLTCTW
jgi:hypothetical protein